MNLNNATVYHFYPLGACGKLPDSQKSNTVTSIKEMESLIPYWKSLGIDCLFLGPIFESLTHGYDTVSYNNIDSRLGTDNDFIAFVDKLHQSGIKIIIDCVFNHVSRNFFAFKDVQWNKENSPYKDWFKGIRFDRTNPHHDGFDYETWDGHYELVKFNLKNHEVTDFLMETALNWITKYQIDGLRMDAADVMELEFLHQLKKSCCRLKDNFMFISEVVHGNYNLWIHEGYDDTVTNYECYKGLYSSLNDKNYFEIEYALTRQFGKEGIYKHQKLINFIDNHDVNRIGSVLMDSAHLYPLYLMLFTMPGTPSIYYGSEWAVKGMKAKGTDTPLRQNWEQIYTNKNENLENAIRSLIQLRKENVALQEGCYQTLFVKSQQIGYTRGENLNQNICLINSSSENVTVPVSLNGEYYDLLNNETIHIHGSVNIYPNWGRVLKKTS